MKSRRSDLFLISLSVAVGLGVASAGQVTRRDGTWRVENARLRLTVDPAAGTVQVYDKEAHYAWRQPESRTGRVRVVIRQAAGRPVIDGRLSDWTTPPLIRLTHGMTADARRVDSDADCSARISLRYDRSALYVSALVTDDDLQFAESGRERWWDKDSLELWVGTMQVGFNLSPEGSQARSATRRLDGARIVLKPNANGRSYAVEAALPWRLFHRPAPKPGESFPLAVGVNDADAAGRREGQLYFPSTWKHSQPDTFAVAVLADASGTVPPVSKAVIQTFRNVTPVHAGLRFETTAAEVSQPLQLTLTLPDGKQDLVVDVDLANRGVSHGPFVALDPFALPGPNAALAVADYCNGHLYSLNGDPLPKTSFSGNRLDMPWLGVTDLDKGYGYALILDTSDDCGVHVESRMVDGRAVRVPRVRWWSSFGSFRYPRRLTYRFCARGGYVALAKAFRAYARDHGLLVTLAEKARRRPNVRRLFGAPDVWGDASLKFARQAKALGVDKMLIHGTSSPKDMQAVDDLGYLTSRYDNYTDILPLKPGESVGSNRGRLPQDAVRKADGKRMTAWLTFDKKTQYMKRCPMLWLDAARKVIPADLKKYPYLGRFIDVTTAEGLYECFDPRHPMTRTQKRLCGQRLEKYVNEELGLVGGGEHGIWWGVPSMCYVEGMMSGGFYSWPAGHLKHPKTKDENLGNPWGRKLPPFSRYEEFGLGHTYRVPLWELVFHDCLVTTWYWGDASDWLLDAAPELTPKKDAFNILYGTIPLLWADAQGSWRKNRAVFLRTYRNTCKLHEQIAGDEMLTHEFVTPDRAVQRTVFSSGTEAVVNFGEKPRRVRVDGKTFLLPRTGFVVRGPKVEESLILLDGKPVTTIRTPGYWYSDAEGTGVTMTAAEPGRVGIRVERCGRALHVDPRLVAPAWTWNAKTALVYRIDDEGQRTHRVDCVSADGTLRLGPLDRRASFEAVFGSAAAKPDLALVPQGMRLASGTLAAGEPLRVEVLLRNNGRKATRAGVLLYVDRTRRPFLLASREITLSGGSETRLSFALPTTRLVGKHRLIAVAACPGAELCRRNNRAETPFTVQPDFSLWPGRVPLEVATGPVARRDAPVVVPVDLGSLARRAGILQPVSVTDLRVAACDADNVPTQLLPTQFDPAPDFDPVDNPKGDLCFVLPGKMPADARKRVVLLLHAGKANLLPSAPTWHPDTATVETPGYVTCFSAGVLTSLAPKVDGKRGPDFLQSLILSSRETGWSREEASTVKRFEVLHTGPVRTVIRVEKELKAGVTYTKTYTFYPHRFDLTISVNKSAGGLYSRAHYRLPGTFIDNAGVTAKVDGADQGGAENRATYGKTKNPRWYAVLGRGWAHSCIALSRFDHLAYWDGSPMGAIGFVGTQFKDVRMSYVIHGPEEDASFAEEDRRQVTTPVTVNVRG